MTRPLKLTLTDAELAGLWRDISWGRSKTINVPRTLLKKLLADYATACAALIACETAKEPADA